MRVDRVSSLVTPHDPVAISEDAPAFVSRGGSKLDSALSRLDVVVEGRRWLDAGASTGGFTDRLLQGGASAVVAVDVGYGQFDWRLRNDPRVTLLERTNVRELSGADLPWVPDACVADLSFISLRTVLPVLARVTAPDADHVLLVKPQFEAGRSALKKGVVRDPADWIRSLTEVADAAETSGLGLIDVVLAEPAGPSGNREFFVHLRRGGSGGRPAIEREVGRATL